MVIASIQYRAIADKESQATDDEDDASNDDEEAVDLKDLTKKPQLSDGSADGLVTGVLTSASPLHKMINECSSFIELALKELVSLKREEYELDHKSSYSEVKYRKLTEQLGKSRETIKMLNSEIVKLNGEFELQKTRATNTKENLNLAVTKGKSLVQQHDSLKQVIVGKTNRLIKSKAYVLPVKVPPYETEDSPMDDTIAQVPEPLDNKPELNENKTRRFKKKQMEEREREIRAAEERLLQKDVPRAADDFEKALRTINIREESEKLNVWVAYFNLKNEYANPQE
ncbi:hypothetical protein Tco_1127580, partial [Tanacetum coccineum]